nr:AAA family ATPase [Bacteroidota bacterium]
MIPLSLKINGLASYKSEQVIDFTKLTAGGLFGIFGTVGSGKSTILDAITLALFGEVEKLGRNEKHYNMMNLDKNDLLVEFGFLAGANNADEYKIIAKAKRNKENFEKVMPDRKAFKNENGQWVPLDLKQTNFELILGLSYDNFRRAIIIPQGKFSEFLSLTPANRREMLMQLFYLQKYDLGDKSKKVYYKYADLFKECETQLLEIGEVTAEGIKEKTDELANAEITLEKISIQYNQKGKTLSELEILKKKYEELFKSREIYVELKKQEQDFLFRGKRLSEYEKCRTEFRDILVAEHELLKRQQELKQKLTAITEEKAANLELKEKLKLDFENAKSAHDKKDDLILLSEDLKKIAEIKLLRQKVKETDVKIAETGANFKAVSDKIQGLKSKAEEKSAEKKKLQESLPDLIMLSRIQS